MFLCEDKAPGDVAGLHHKQVNPLKRHLLPRPATASIAAGLPRSQPACPLSWTHGHPWGERRATGIAPKDNIDILDEQIPNSVKKFYEGGHGFFLEDYRAWKDVISFLKD